MLPLWTSCWREWGNTSFPVFSLQYIAVKWIDDSYPVLEIVIGGIGLGQRDVLYLLARAYSLAQASVAAPFEYAALLYNVMWGFLIWREVPTWAMWAGVILTILSGVYILYRERRERERPLPNPAG